MQEKLFNNFSKNRYHFLSQLIRHEPLSIESKSTLNSKSDPQIYKYTKEITMLEIEENEEEE